MAGQCPELSAVRLATVECCAALLPLLRALMARASPSQAQRVLRNDTLSLLLRTTMADGGAAALQGSGALQLLLAAAAAAPPETGPPPQPPKLASFGDPSNGYAAALAASRAAAAHAAASRAGAPRAAAAAPAGADASLLRLTQGRTLEDFETRQLVFAILLQCVEARPEVARAAAEAGLCAALLTYFGDAASPATDPREGWTADQRSTLQVLSLSLLQALALV